MHYDGSNHGDHRWAGQRASESRKFNEDRKILTFEYEDGDGEERVGEIPTKFEVCPTCDGKGKHVNPNIDDNGLGAEDFAEDPDFAEDYFSGVHDVTCYDCGGKRVVPVPDEDRADKDLLKHYHAGLESDATYAAECAAERRMGA